MDPSQDNPIIRFKAFWWGLGAFALFGVLAAIIALTQTKPAATLEDVVAADRYAKRRKVEAAQDANLAYKVIEADKFVQVPPSVAMSVMAKKIGTSKPVAVEKPDQLIPGSVTAKKLAEQAAGAAPVELPKVDEKAPIDPSVMEMGKTGFALCAACHGADGNGVPNIAPPLAGSEWVMGPVENLIRIQLRGLQGPITVKGKEYNLMMAALSFQSDEQIAAVLTYVRNSFGNKASSVIPAQVKALRGEVGLPPVKASELKAPN